MLNPLSENEQLINIVFLVNQICYLFIAFGDIHAKYIGNFSEKG